MNLETSDKKMPWEELTNGLYYPSESDEPIEYIEFTYQAAPPLTVSQVKNLVLIPADIFMEEVAENEFWEPVLTEQDWYGEEEKAVLNRFKILQEEVNRQLADRQVFRSGRIEIDVFLLGRKPDGSWAGLKTRVVET
ncbi:nuclease A inhibitor family protein [Tellurirhabdus bombi]|uniref:nuclease A inhibitor family protein n=1 Tax=Tellurirhabdus bombi TaxID=2907205 RepID=UPI001F1ED4DE|nr:nuclease A inhibitor family protein [Tellurirhabdus bombi]